MVSGANLNLQDSSHMTPLQSAASVGHLDVVKLLLNARARYDMKTAYGENVLHVAVKAKNEDIVDHLLQKCNYTPPTLSASALSSSSALSPYPALDFVNAVDFKRHTPLHLAAELGLNRSVIKLLASGANVNAKDVEGITPLHLAAHQGKLEVVKSLVNNGCNVNSATRKGFSALRFALIQLARAREDEEWRQSCLHAIKILLQAKSDIFLCDSYGTPPLVLALEYEARLTIDGDLELMRVILHYGNVYKGQHYETPTTLETLEELVHETPINLPQMSRLLCMLLHGGLLAYADLKILSSQNSSIALDVPNTPMSLKHLVRLAIRIRVDDNHISGLNMPKQLMDFLCYGVSQISSSQ